MVKIIEVCERGRNVSGLGQFEDSVKFFRLGEVLYFALSQSVYIRYIQRLKSRGLNEVDR